MDPSDTGSQNSASQGPPSTGESHSPPNASNPSRLTPYSSFLQLPEQFPEANRQRVTHVDHPSLYHNEFPAPKPKGDPGSSYSNDVRILRPKSPILFIDSADGERRQLGDQDYKNALYPGSESEASDVLTEVEFKSIKTVGDGGLGAWEPHFSPPSNDIDDSQPSSGASSPTAMQSGAGPSTVINGCFAGVGGFVSPNQVTATASSEELSKFLDDADLEADFADSLYDKLEEAVKKSAFNLAASFLPLDKLCSILNRTNIHRLLKYVYSEWNDEELSQYTDDICGPGVPSTGRRKILAILIMIEQVACIHEFVKVGITDLDLPLESKWKSKHGWLCKKGDKRLSNLASCYRNWVRRDFNEFESRQPWMQASFFNMPDNEICYYKLSQDYVLPFTFYEHKKRGGYGSVCKVKIHRAHHNYKSPEHLTENNPYFALKALHQHDTKSFKKEVEVLQRFSGANTPNPHLIRLLLAFRHGDTHYLLFNWADGDLKQFWASHPTPRISCMHARWVMKQCLGIAKGLQKIHHVTSNSWPEKAKKSVSHRAHLVEADAEFKDKNAKNWGRHGDVKPENILWFCEQDRNRLVISDFGLSRYHSYRSKSNNPHENLEGFSPTYRPPECDLRLTISPRYDIWALGCVYLEFLSWFVFGNATTESAFASDRIRDDQPLVSHVKEDKFFNVLLNVDSREQYAVVKPSVKKWIRRLHDNENCPGFVHSFLDLIEEHLLVVESNDRWDCGAIVAELTNIRDECDRSEDYCFKGSPRASSNNDLNGVDVGKSAWTTVDGDQQDDDDVEEVFDFTGPQQGLSRHIEEELTSNDDNCDDEGRSEEVANGAPEVSVLADDELGPSSGKELQVITTAILRHDSSMSVLDREEDIESEVVEIGGDKNEHVGEKEEDDNGAIARKDARRSTDSRAAPALPNYVTDETILTTQASDGPRNYSTDITPALSNTVSLDSYSTKRGVPYEVPGMSFARVWTAGGESQEQSFPGRPGRESSKPAAEPQADREQIIMDPEVKNRVAMELKIAPDAPLVEDNSGVQQRPPLSSSNESTQAQGTSEGSTGALHKMSHDHSSAVSDIHVENPGLQATPGRTPPAKSARKREQSPTRPPVKPRNSFMDFLKRISCF